MRVSDAMTAGWRVLSDRPADVFPLYLVALGVLPVARVPVLLGVAITVGLLRVEGRIAPVVTELRRVDFGSLEAGNPESVPPALGEAVARLVTPETVLVLSVAVVLAVLVFVLARGVAAAVVRAGLYAAVDDRDPLTEGLAGADRWRTFAGLVTIRLLTATIPLVLLLSGGVALTTGGAAAVGGVLVLLLGVLALPVGLVIQLLLVFAPVAAVVDDVGVIGAVRHSARFFRRNPLGAIGFVLVMAGLYVGAATMTGVLNLVGAGRVGGLAFPLVVTPIIDAIGTALYADESPRVRDRPAARTRIIRGVRTGWAELVGFVRTHPVAVLLAGGLFGLGTASGWFVTAPFGTRLSPPVEAESVFGAVPVGTFVNIAVNNWLVAAGGAFGGLGFGVAPVASMVFNGALVGALAGVFDRIVFLALVAPHGIIEVPALAIAGGLGLHLGRVGSRAIRGQATAAEVGGELQRAMRVLVGLALVFLVAAFIEAFLTPRIAAFILG